MGVFWPLLGMLGTSEKSRPEIVCENSFAGNLD